MATYINPDAVKDNSLSIEKIDNVALDLADKVNALSDEGKNTFLNKIGLGKIGVISQKQNWTSDYSSYTISDVVRGIIPYHIINHWNALSSKIKLNGNVEFRFNEETGYFECNDLVDITLEDAINIIFYGDVQVYQRKAFSRTIRVVFCSELGGDWLYTSYIGISKSTECVWCQAYLNANRAYVMNLQEVFDLQCLKEIFYINLESATNSIYFRNALALIKFLAIKLKKDISFVDSPLLSNESVLFLINHEAATSAITITLHADAYARAMADADILSALEQHTNISLASA